MSNVPPTMRAQSEPTFPQPVYFGRYRRWKVSDILGYEAALQGVPAPVIAEDDECWMSAGQLRKRYGVSDMWLWRRLNRA